jgi:hypothetical protein
MSDKEFKRFNSLPDSGLCDSGMGSRRSVSGYEFKKGFNTNHMYNLGWNVKVFGELNFKGKSTLLKEGEHNLNRYFKVKSIIIPKNYLVVLTGKDTAKSFYGPLKVNLSDKYNLINVRRQYKKHAIFCDDIEGYKNCYIYGPGRHVLHPNQYWKIRYVNSSPTVSKVILYQDSNFLDPVWIFDNFKYKQNYHLDTIEYPKIIRSIEII